MGRASLDRFTFCVAGSAVRQHALRCLLLAAVLLVLRQPPPIQAQGIAFDAVTTSPGGQTSFESWSHTVATSEANRVLIVGVVYDKNGSVTNVTYNGVNLTHHGTVNNTDKANVEIWYLVNPATGTNTVTVTTASADETQSVAASFLNVDQTTPLGTFFSATGQSTATSVTVTGVAEGELVFDTLCREDNTTVTVGAQQTQRWNGTAAKVETAGSTEPGPAGGGNVTMSWTLGGNKEWAQGAVALKPANPTAVTLRSFTATHHHGGVLLHWRTGLDVNNLGWHIYREVNGERVKLTPELIAGSALMLGPGIQLNAGNAYRWWDPAGSDTDRYWLEDRDLNGQRTVHGPVTPVMTDQPPPKMRRSTLLSQIGREPTARTKAGISRPQRQVGHQSRGTVRQRVTSSQTLQPWEAPNLPPHAIQHTLAAVPAIKLNVWESGWYRVTQPELVAAGLDPNVDPRRLQLFADGQPQSIVVPGEEDGRFGPQEAIEF